MAERIYTTIYQGKNDWLSLLRNDLDVNYLLVPQNTQANLKEVQYYPNFDVRLRRSLAVANLPIVINGQHYCLYSIKQAVTNDVSLIDMPTGSISKIVSIPTFSGHYYLPVQYPEVLKGHHNFDVYTDNALRTQYDIEVASKAAQYFFPDTSQLPYQKANVESSVFSTTGMSLQILNLPYNPYNLFHQKMPSMDNLVYPRFVGTTSQSSGILVSINVPETDGYDLLIKAAAASPDLPIDVDGHTYTAKAVGPDQTKWSTTPIYQYYEVKINLASGNHRVVVLPLRSSAVLVNGVYPRRIAGLKQKVQFVGTNDPQKYKVVVNGQ